MIEQGNMSNIFLDPIWCSEHIEKICNKANHRYKPELNIEISINEIFDGISRSEQFYEEIRENYGKLDRSIKDSLEKIKDFDEFKDFKRISDDLLKKLKKIKCFSIEKIPWHEIANQSQKLIDILYELSDESQKWAYVINSGTKDQDMLIFFKSYAESTEGLLSNNPFLFLVGEAGIGKTHLLCKIVSDRLNANSIAPSVLVFGEELDRDKEIMPQVIHRLHLGESIKNNRQFLEQLNEAGKKANCRSLFILDAANEILNLRDSRQLMQKLMQKLYEEVRDYPYIALVISVRKGFKDLFINEAIKKNFQIISHPGLRYKEKEAVDLFFREYNVPLLEIPLLRPEFSNPLFLLLFCIAFKNTSRTQRKKDIFRGHEGATHIFEKFVKRVSRKIIKKHGLPKGRTDNKLIIWDTVIKKMAEHMVEKRTDRLPEQEVIDIIHEAHPKVKAVKFLKDLESNMLVAKVPKDDIASGQQPNCDYRFPFQKFSDHLRARYILKKYRHQKETSKKTPKQFFAKNTRLGKHLLNSDDRGLIEALMIQCPEWIKNTELVEAAPYLVDEYSDFDIDFVFESFIDSLVWRKPKAFSPKTIKLIDEPPRKYYSYDEALDELLDVFITVTGCPNHPLNADFLHRRLEKLSMPERDSRWSIFLYNQAYVNAAAERLLEWAWSEPSQEHLPQESLLLLSKTLVWFLTTPNRIVRDKATKGLVRILTNHLDICHKLLEIFKDVNDMYVLERLYAVMYGCVMRNFTDKSGIKKIALWIYDKQFSKSQPLPHLLLRDYARGVIEVALNRGILSKIGIDEQKINPPYKSEWITQPYTKEELKQKYYPEEESDGNRGMGRIWHSVIDGGDFDRYIIGTNSSCDWSRKQFGQEVIDKSVLLNDFINSLTPKQKALWAECHADTDEKGEDNLEEIPEIPIAEVKIRKIMKVRKAVENFKKSLDKEKPQLFEKDIYPYLDNYLNIREDCVERFDLSIAQCWILNRVYELGWNPEIHGEFDYSNSSQGRDSHKPERIGKKYQWLAYYEFFARVSDNFEFVGEGDSNTKQKYKGPWNPYRRDIDPSFNLRPEMEESGVIFEKWENEHLTYNAWNKNIWDWVKSSKSMPKPEKIILIKDDTETEWLLLNGYIRWAEDVPPEEDKDKSPRCNMSYILEGFIVHNNDYQAAIRWTKNQLSTRRGMPENDFSEVFLGEYPNSEAYTDIQPDTGNWNNKENPASLRLTDATYINDVELDCSLPNRFTIKMPSEFLVNGMNLKQLYVDGKFYDEKKTLIASPISIWKDSKLSGVLIRKNSLLEFMQRTNNKIFWICSARKYIIDLMSTTRGKEEWLEMRGTYYLNKNGDISGKLKRYTNSRVKE